MRLLVFGATGATGAHVVNRALFDGHAVTALARRPEAVGINHPNLTVCAGDARLGDTFAGILRPGDVVISALGEGSSRAPTRVYSESVAAIITAMDQRRSRRLVVISAAPVSPAEEKTRLDRRILHPMLTRFFEETYVDMARMEALLRDSAVDWTVFRPPRLTDKPAVGAYRTAIGEPLPRARSIPRADLAAAMLDAIDDQATTKRAVAVAA